MHDPTLVLMLTPLLTLSFLVHSLVAWHIPKSGGPTLAAASGIVMVLVSARLCSVNLVVPFGSVWDTVMAFLVYGLLIFLGIRRLVDVFGGDPIAVPDQTRSR